MPGQIDVLVIGAGVAGAVAAARARQRGLMPLCVAESCGATGYSSGAVNGVWNSDSESALELFCSLSPELGWVKTQRAITELGWIKDCVLVQGTQSFDFQTGSLGVVEWIGLSGFSAASVTKVLHSQGYEATPLSVDLRDSWAGPAAFAHAFDAEDFQARCLKKIELAVREMGVKMGVKMGVRHLLFPAVLGFANPSSFLDALKAHLGVTGSELLGHSHSIPGLRLANALKKNVQPDTVVSWKCENQQVKEVYLKSGEIIFPKSVVLATGRFLSGGFKHLDLPVVGAELFKKGLAFDESQRPLDRFGEVYATNLFAAGSALGGYDPVQDGGMSQAIVTGYRAGELC